MCLRICFIGLVGLLFLILIWFACRNMLRSTLLIKMLFSKIMLKPMLNLATLVPNLTPLRFVWHTLLYIIPGSAWFGIQWALWLFCHLLSLRSKSSNELFLTSYYLFTNFAYCSFWRKITKLVTYLRFQLIDIHLWVCLNAYHVSFAFLSSYLRYRVLALSLSSPGNPISLQWYKLSVWTTRRSH